MEHSLEENGDRIEPSDELDSDAQVSQEPESFQRSVASTEDGNISAGPSTQLQPTGSVLKEARIQKFPPQVAIEGTQQDVQVVWASNPKSFYCQLVDNSTLFLLFMEKLENFYRNETSEVEAISYPQAGMACVAKVDSFDEAEDKHDGFWYRGEIVKCIADSGESGQVKLVEILFVDLGKKRTTYISMVKRITNEFLTLPPQAYHCSLDGVPSCPWTSKEIARFKNATLDKRFTATFINRLGGTPNSRTKFSVLLSEDFPDGTSISINNMFTPADLHPAPATPSSSGYSTGLDFSQKEENQTNSSPTAGPSSSNSSLAFQRDWNIPSSLPEAIDEDKDVLKEKLGIPNDPKAVISSSGTTTRFSAKITETPMVVVHQQRSAVTGPSASSRGKRLISSSKTYLVHQQRFIEIECITIDSDLDEVMEIMPPSNATTLSLHLASDSDGAPTEELRLNLANASDSELTIEESPRKDESTRSSIDWDLDDTIEEPPRNAQTAGNRNDSDLDTTMEETELSTHNLTATADNWIDEEAMEVVRSPRDPGIPKQLRMDCRVNLGERVPSVSPVYLPQSQYRHLSRSSNFSRSSNSFESDDERERNPPRSRPKRRRVEYSSASSSSPDEEFDNYFNDAPPTPSSHSASDAASDSDHWDVNNELEVRFANLVRKLKSAVAKAQGIIERVDLEAHLVPLRHFKYAVRKYISFLQKLNDDQLETAFRWAQHHWLFGPDQLSRWIKCKQTELDWCQKMANLRGIVFLPDSTELKSVLNSLEDDEFALVLFVPKMDRWSGHTCQKMLEYVSDSFSKLQTDEADYWSDDEEHPSLPWCTKAQKQKLITDRFRELGSHLKTNKNGPVVRVYVTFNGSGKNCRSSFSIYKGAQCIKYDLQHLPVRPSGFRALPLLANGTPLYRVTWKYEELDYPFKFIVVYRPRGSARSWTKVKAVSRIYFRPDEELEMQVAVETGIGRSRFSRKFIVPAVDDDMPANVEALTGPLANLVLREVVEFSTRSAPEITLAQHLANHWNQIKRRRGKPLLSVPVREMTNGNETFKRFVYGEPDVNNLGSGPSRRKEHRTILLAGAVGSGKISFINEMVNYIFGVHRLDPFRFQLVDDSRDRENRRKGVIVYEINHMEGFRIPHSLTIVDTPEYSGNDGLDGDLEISESLRKYLKHKDAVQHLDLVGIVSKASFPRRAANPTFVFELILSNFGANVKENIVAILTSSDSTQPAILKSIIRADLPFPTENRTEIPFHHKFYPFCSAKSCANKESFETFFSDVSTLTRESLTSTKHVLEERRRLEGKLEEIHPLFENGLDKVKEVDRIKKSIEECEEEQLEFDEEGSRVQRKKKVAAGATNCDSCRMTCFLGAKSNSEDFILCPICPGNCSWEQHQTGDTYYWWESMTADSLSESKRRFVADQRAKQMELENDVDDINEALSQHTDFIARCLQRLDEIALLPEPFWMQPDYIDGMIGYEGLEERLPTAGSDRAKRIEIRHQKAMIVSKINEDLPLL